MALDYKSTIGSLRSEAKTLTERAAQLNATADSLQAQLDEFQASVGNVTAYVAPKKRARIRADSPDKSTMEIIEDILRNHKEAMHKDKLLELFNLVIGREMDRDNFATHLSRGKKLGRLKSHGEGVWGLAH